MKLHLFHLLIHPHDEKGDISHLLITITVLKITAVIIINKRKMIRTIRVKRNEEMISSTPIQVLVLTPRRRGKKGAQRERRG